MDILDPFRSAAQDFNAQVVAESLHEVMAPDARLHLCYPFGDLIGPDALLNLCLQPLSKAMPDLERRELVTLSGRTAQGQDWIACCGNYMGTFLAPFLDIPPTGHLAHMRYHEFFRVEEGRVTQMQAIWDIPELMMQAGAWPMAPQLGRFLMTPAPASQDGLDVRGDGSETMSIVVDMLTDLCRHPAQGGPEVMRLERYWHPRFNWYGPSGIGTGRGLEGFRNWHQIPFLRGMPDRRLDSLGDLMSNWIAAGNYVAETGWPNMRLTLSGDGWMGIPPLGREVFLRSLDFWRIENGLIRENWVLVDLLDLYAQIGVDVLGRMAEFNKARVPSTVQLPSDITP